MPLCSPLPLCPSHDARRRFLPSMSSSKSFMNNDEPLELVARLHRLSKQLHEVHHLLLRVRRLALGFGLREVRLCQLGVARALLHRDQPLVGHDRQHVVEHLRSGVRRGVRRGAGPG